MEILATITLAKLETKFQAFFIIIAFYEYKVDLSGARLHLTLVDPEASYVEID